MRKLWDFPFWVLLLFPDLSPQALSPHCRKGGFAMRLSVVTSLSWHAFNRSRSLMLFSRSVVSNSSTSGTAARQASLSFSVSLGSLQWVGDAIQPFHPLSSPSPPAPNPSQHQGLFQWVSSSHDLAKVLEFQLQHQSFQWTPRTDFLQDGLVGSPCSPRDSQESSPAPQFKSISSAFWGHLLDGGGQGCPEVLRVFTTPAGAPTAFCGAALSLPGPCLGQSPCLSISHPPASFPSWSLFSVGLTELKVHEASARQHRASDKCPAASRTLLGPRSTCTEYRGKLTFKWFRLPGEIKAKRNSATLSRK